MRVTSAAAKLHGWLPHSIGRAGTCPEVSLHVEYTHCMKFSRGRSQVVFWFLALLLLAVRSHAVLFKSTADPSYNTNAPTGALTNSGWQYEGQWNGFLATPIAPAFFIAAKHVGGSMGDVFVLNGFTYHTVAFSDCPNCDLRVWQVAETFPMYAPLYTNANEVGNHCVVFGRGTQRGDAVVVNPQTNGWKWGVRDGVERWGENDVTSIYDDPNLGQFLQCTFDRNGGSNECHLSVGDSSGALFIQDGSTWKLAGIHYAVDGPFSADGTTNTQFDAALLDMGGLYGANDNTGQIGLTLRKTRIRRSQCVLQYAHFSAHRLDQQRHQLLSRQRSAHHGHSTRWHGRSNQPLDRLEPSLPQWTRPATS